MGKLYAGYFLVDAWDSICLPRYETKEAAEKAHKVFPNCRVVYLAESPQASPAAPPAGVGPSLVEINQALRKRLIERIDENSRLLIQVRDLEAEVAGLLAAPPAGPAVDLEAILQAMDKLERLETDEDMTDGLDADGIFRSYIRPAIDTCRRALRSPGGSAHG